MKSSGFRDTFRVLHPNETNVGTTNAFRETTEPNKIDYIYVDDRWDVSDAEIRHDKVDGRWITDHLPVTATVILKQ
jgi:endonuclease/exonuclease/phosphatase family metal-dependent hydrolase